jgi:polar amino acid transport system substrate-binding protein
MKRSLVKNKPVPLLRRVFFVAAMFIVASPAQALKLLSDENAPFAYTDSSTQQIVGMTHEMVVEACKRAKVPCTIKLVPWARANVFAEADPDTCVYPLARLPERESLFQWIGPLSTNKWVLFARSDFQRAINDVDDAKNYAIGGLLRDGPTLFLRSKGISVDMVGDAALNVKKLAAGRIDLWATGLHRGRRLAAEAHITSIKPVFVLKEVDHYLACNPQVPTELIKSLNQAVETMRSDGVIKKITDQYQERE